MNDSARVEHLMRPKAIGYARVTSHDNKTGKTIPLQEKSIKGHAAAAGWKLLAIYKDEALSGSNGLDTRRGLASALSALEGREAEVLIISEYSRLARDLVIQETLIQQLASIGVRVVAVMEPEVGGDEHTRTLVRQVLGAVKQYERAVIRARTEVGRARAVADGRRGQGQPPFGYRAKGPGLLEPIPDEQDVLATMRAWQTDGMALAEIARRLNDQGLSARRGRWHPTSVARVLRRAAPG